MHVVKGTVIHQARTQYSTRNGFRRYGKRGSLLLRDTLSAKNVYDGESAASVPPLKCRLSLRGALRQR